MAEQEQNHVAIIIMVVFLIILAILILWLIFARPTYPGDNHASVPNSTSKDIEDKSGRYSGNRYSNRYSRDRYSGNRYNSKSENYSGKDENYVPPTNQQCQNGSTDKHIRMDSNDQIRELNPSEYYNEVDNRFSGLDMSEGDSLYEDRKGNRRKFHNK